MLCRPATAKATRLRNMKLHKRCRSSRTRGNIREWLLGTTRIVCSIGLAATFLRRRHVPLHYGEKGQSFLVLSLQWDHGVAFENVALCIKRCRVAASLRRADGGRRVWPKAAGTTVDLPSCFAAPCARQHECFRRFAAAGPKVTVLAFR
nr:hypothetical protein CFP56_58814 [Quercus suber]